MATITGDAAVDYLNSENTVRSWLLTRDHKRIGLLFFGSITFFFFIGGIAATLMRLHLATPEGLLQPCSRKSASPCCASDSWTPCSLNQRA